MKFLVIIIAAVVASEASRETFSAIEELESIALNDKQLIIEVEWFIKQLETKLNDLKRKLINRKKEFDFMNQDVFGYILNPLNAYLLIKRVSVDIVEIKRDIEAITEEFRLNTRLTRLPYSDFDGAVDGFIRLQQTYNLKTKDLAQGIIQGVKYRDELKAHDLFAIGDRLMNFGTRNYKLSLEYLNLALDFNKKSPDMSEIRILEAIFDNFNKTEKFAEALETLEKIVEIEPGMQINLKQARENLKLINEKDEPKEEPRDGNYTPLKEFTMLSKMCSGEWTQSANVTSKLFCHFISNSHFSKIAPFKVEVVNLDPYIAVYFDVINDDEIEVLKKLSRPHFKRAEVRKNSTDTVASLRIAKVAWHKDSTHKTVYKLSKRVADMTGLSLRSAEQLQVQNYGIGGYYSLHYDFSAAKEKDFQLGLGNRIATAMFYMTDVEAGGATVFPFIRVLVPARKGSMAFWYNLSTSGDREYLTRHAACPVIIGTKWVANKWFHEYHNEFRRPCELKEAPTDQFYFKKFF